MTKKHYKLAAACPDGFELLNKFFLPTTVSIWGTYSYILFKALDGTIFAMRITTGRVYIESLR